MPTSGTGNSKLVARRSPLAAMTTYVGTSGWAYKEWKGSFYPEKIAAAKMLAFYGEQLNGVEINNTFYRMPSEKVLTGWHDEVPDDFAFVLKCSRRITHFKRLKADARDELDYFLRTSAVLREKLGPTLFQLPPNLKKDLERLKTFLALLPARWRAAFEFRHPSWFDEDVYAALRDVGATLVLAETEDTAPPRVATASTGYLRLRKADYAEEELADWARWAAAQEWEDVFVFFKHEDGAIGPAFARRYREVADAL